MRIINYDKNRINIILSFVPKLWKIHWFGVRTNTFMYKFYLNIMLIGLQFRLIIYKPLKNITICELKQIINEQKKESDKNK